MGNPEEKRVNSLGKVPIILIFLLGVGIMAYPRMADQTTRKRSEDEITQLQEQWNSVDVAYHRTVAETYNESLRRGEVLPDAEYASILDIQDGMMGSLEIPAIQVSLPICHGTDEAVLSYALGHLPQSSFPIGGEGNHAVLTGHTGLPRGKLLTDLTKLEIGDSFYVSILGSTLIYQVDQIKTVLPSETGDLQMIPGKDYCTLVTCIPYGINSHRLLVRGIRVE